MRRLQHNVIHRGRKKYLLASIPSLGDILKTNFSQGNNSEDWAEEKAKQEKDMLNDLF